MLKFIFWSLLCMNAVLLAYGQGLLGNFKGGEREPARMKKQLNSDKLKLIPAPAPGAAAMQPPTMQSAALTEAPPPIKATPLACLLVGNFNAADGRRFENLVAALELGERQTRENVTVQEVSSHIVFIPSQGSKEGADRKAAELKNLGVSNYFIMNETTPMKWAISLGVFKSENAAQTLLAALVKQGVANAKVAARMSQASRQAYRLRDLDADTKAKVEAITARFPQQAARKCG